MTTPCDVQVMSDNNSPVYHVRLIMVGEARTGKTSIMDAYMSRKVFSTEYMPSIGVDFLVRTVKLGSATVKLQVWDTAGNALYRDTNVAMYYKNSHGIMIVYDITDRPSFERVEFWVSTLRRHNTAQSSIMLIGNKRDLVDARLVTTQEGRELAVRLGCAFFETSVRDGTNLDSVYTTLIESLLTTVSATARADKSQFERYLDAHWEELAPNSCLVELPSDCGGRIVRRGDRAAADCAVSEYGGGQIHEVDQRMISDAANGNHPHLRRWVSVTVVEHTQDYCWSSSTTTYLVPEIVWSTYGKDRIDSLYYHEYESKESCTGVITSVLVILDDEVVTEQRCL